MYAWGSTINGELGLGGIEDEHILTPRALDWYLANKVVECALGDNHTLFLTNEGKVYSCGNNDYGQLGHDQPRKRPQPVTGLDAYNITHVSCGANHSVALNQWGQVFSWGSDYHGQLGQQLGENIQPVPKIVRNLASHHVVQLVCGQRHTVALTNSGEILTWGANNFGQLGLGFFSSSETVPQPVTSLRGIPIVFITCGAYHTFAISKSGAVYGWGKNTRGQIGLNDSANKMFPTQLKTLRNLKVRFIACGEEFSAFLTLDGGVFTCGAGMYGQLGHGSNSNEILPRQVIELMGSTVTQLACGRQHCLAFVPSRGRVYSFGIGGSGQLGVRKTNSAYTPQAVLGPWVSPGGSSLIPSDNKNKQNLVIQRIFAGGDHCFVSVVPQEKKIPPYDCRDYDPQTQILTVTPSYLKTLLRIPLVGPVDQDVISFLETVFKSLACLNGSFLLEDDRHYYCTSKHHGLDMIKAENTFDLIGKIENESIQNLIWTGITEDVLRQLIPNPPDVEALRIYLILPLYHEFNNLKQYMALQKPFASSALRLKQPANKVVGGWWSMMTPDYFEKLVNIFKNVASYILRNQKIPQGRTAFYDAALVSMLDLMAYLNKLNHNGAEGLKVPYETFHISDLQDYLDIRYDYVLWLTDQDSGKLYLCNYPFLFDATAKLQLLETDQSIQMHSAMQNAAQQAVVAAMFSPNRMAAINQFLMLNITRDHIVEDTLRELSSVTPQDLKKPLKIKFCGEEAEDAGGVTKEFFMLLLREILDPKYGMFKEYEETRAIWFSENTFEENSVYFLIGMICGLAIYNFTIIDIPFPLALYKKLLGEPVGLNDLKDLSPSIMNSLKSLLEYDGDDLDEVFCLNFSINRDIWGEIVTVDLKPNGANISVTQENKREYVSLYVDYVFNKSVNNQYTAFHEGFMKVCDGRVLQLFHSHELMAIVVGNENYDWHVLEEVAEYKNGYTSSDPTIRYFWEVIHEMSLEDKKKFLLFLTGTYRIPIQGMKAIKITIQPTTDDKFLPVAHTCFNLLDLPRYKTKERLRYKLMQAIQQTQGFSLV
ncbi:probable E3 ubiquitin-protein ligase HERC4 isoform X2 [Anthonomus grandis grandis]|uniref:probable E3 ubiquitin-protein ligase HERC4 isoform X2 n=1 Tax=Anthonomus grandis grandis TaxID=2921223 RepID=UPI0021650FAB|nr:probable E3 ubiquitin-protein ligase HERC4 isoform X2 [Anthonomus grandis grandis]